MRNSVKFATNLLFYRLVIIVCLCVGSSYAQFGKSYSQIMYKLSPLFKMKRVSNVDGDPRYMGTLRNNMATLEIIGNKRNPKSATLIVGFPSDNEYIVKQSILYATRFLMNTTNIEEPATWFTEEVIKGGGHYTGSGYSVEIKLIKSLGLVCVTVK